MRKAASSGSRAFSSVLRRFRRGEQQVWRDQDLIQQLAPLLADSNLTSYLIGYRRSMMEISQHRILRLAVSPTFRAAQRWLKDRLNLSKEQMDQLREKYEADAFLVLHTAEESAERKLQETIIDIHEQGMHVRQGVSLLKKTFDSVGLSPRNSFQLEAIFRTQSQMAYGAGRWAADQDEAVQEILWGYYYVTVGDDRVRPTHRAMEGFRAPKEHDIWKTHWPPNGWACRCSTIKIFNDDPESERTTKLPPGQTQEVGRDVRVAPDKGFSFNSGQAIKVQIDEPEPAIPGERAIPPSPPETKIRFPSLKKKVPFTKHEHTEEARTIFKETNKYLRRHKLRGATQAQRAAFEVFDDYHGYGYERLNKQLRTTYKGKKLTRSSKPGKLGHMIDNAPPSPQDVFVYRYQNFDPEAVSGEVFSVDGFVSTSYGSALEKFEGDVAFEIFIPKGSKGVMGFDSWEAEVLLNHRSKFKVVDVGTTTNIGPKKKKVYRLEYLGT